MKDQPEQATQVPESMRLAKRWQIAFKVWALTTVAITFVGTLCVVLIEFGIKYFFHGRFDYHPIRVALTVMVVVGISGIPTFINTFRSYPPGRVDAWHRTLK